MSEPARARILVVDDDTTIRHMLTDWLSERYEVESVCSGVEALVVLEKRTFDLVLSDINMPGLNGFETLRRIRELYPTLKTSLITDYNVDSYIRIALDENITSIITKQAPFQAAELFRTVDNLLTGRRVFGLANYMAEGTSLETVRIREITEIQGVRERLVVLAENSAFGRDRSDLLRMVFEEIASNAVYHAYGYQKFQDVRLKDDEVVEISIGRDDICLGFSVSDQSGRLTKEVVLRKILRAMSPDGILDTEGRGLFLTRSFSDRFIINIRPGKTTEIIVLIYFATFPEGNKPLYINVM